MGHRSGRRHLALLLSLCLLALAPVNASAQTAEDVERADAARDGALAALRRADDRLQEAITEYHAVNGELEQLTFEIARLFDIVKDHESEAVSLRHTAQSAVVAAYTSGGREFLDVALSARSIQDALTTRIILDRAAERELASVGRLEAVRAVLGDLKHELTGDQERVFELRARAQEVVFRLDQAQRDADAAYRFARERAAAELEAYEEERARIRAEEERLAALRAARIRGAAAGVDDTITPGFSCPVPQARFINDWGFPRSGGRTHKGTDMFAPRGTPVLAVADGTVTLDTYKLGGTVASLRADHGVTYYFAHLDGYAADVVTGQRVATGDVIGYVGNTGNALGGSPHLHFQIHPNHRAATNPYPTLRRHC
jgi:murein DD-endopeptidase MepM/ murein hydrolase activator NlpD